MALLQDTAVVAPAPAKTHWFARHYLATAVGAALLGAALAVGGALALNANSGSSDSVDTFGISTQLLNSPDGDGERAARRLLENAQ
ncbi:MAG: hypothetical protein ACT4QF_18965 [Sporichthyaceae bacterium]